MKKYLFVFSVTLILGACSSGVEEYIDMPPKAPKELDFSGLDSAFAEHQSTFETVNSGLEQLYAMLQHDTAQAFFVDHTEKQLEIANHMSLIGSKATRDRQYFSADDSGPSLGTNAVELGIPVKRVLVGSFEQMVAKAFKENEYAVSIFSRTKGGTWPEAVPQIRSQDEVETITSHLNQLATTRYLIFDKILIYDIPQMITKTEFRTGRVCKMIYVYDLHKAQLLGSFYAYVESSDNVQPSGFSEDATTDFQLAAYKDMSENMSELVDIWLSVYFSPRPE